jgi:hypothetical protein
MSTEVSEVRAASIALMMEAARTSEMSVNIQLRTRQSQKILSFILVAMRT